MCLNSEYPGDTFLWQRTYRSPAESKNMVPFPPERPALIGWKGSHLSFIDMANPQNGHTHILSAKMKSTRGYINPSSEREERT